MKVTFFDSFGKWRWWDFYTRRVKRDAGSVMMMFPVEFEVVMMVMGLVVSLLMLYEVVGHAF